MKFTKMVNAYLESMTAGGVSSTFGDSGDIGTNTQGDFYAPGDTRIPYSIFGGKVITRHGTASKNKRKKKKKSKKKAKAKNNSSNS